MCYSLMYVFLYFLVILLPFLLSESAKVAMNGVLEWEIPQVQKGDYVTCLDGQKLAVKVSLPQPQDEATSFYGRFVVSSTVFPWPFHPHEVAPLSPAPSSSLTDNNPVGPHQDGIPFISSNPDVPLPTDEIDSATILPLSTSGRRHSKQVQIALISMVLLMMMII